jgi:hypothetical protein
MSRAIQNQPSNSTARQTVKGTVVSSTGGEPIAGALVELSGTTQASQFAGPGGSFQFENVPEGQVSITAQKPGFLNAAMQMTDPFAYRNSQFTVGPNMKDVQVKLIPECQLTGRVINSDGEPLHNVFLQIMSEQIFAGRTRWLHRGGASTDENGLYRIENLPPGRYLIRTASRAMFVNIPAALQQAAEQSDPISTNVDLNLGYPSTYYPSAADMTAAQPLEIKPGEEARADFNIAPQHGFHVGGVVAGISNDPVMVSVEGPDGQSVPIASRVNPRTGRFRLPLVYPGTWTLVFRTQARGPGGAIAKQSVTVGSTDVTNLQVQMQPLASIPVQVDESAATTPSTAVPAPGDPAQQPPQRARVWVQLIPTDPSENMWQFASVRQGVDAPLAIPNVPPGNYRAIAQSFGTAECLDTITAGGVDLTKSEYALSDGGSPVPIQVALRSDCASLKGTVRSPSPNPSGVVVLVAKNLALSPKLSQIGTDGSFSFAGLSPGDYQLYALSSSAGLEYEEPDGMRGLSGQDLHLDPSQASTVSTDLIVRGDPP